MLDVDFSNISNFSAQSSVNESLSKFFPSAVVNFSWAGSLNKNGITIDDQNEYGNDLNE